MAGCWKNSIVNCNVFPQASYVSCALFHTCFLKILKVYFSLIYKCCKPQRKSLKETLESPWTSTLKSSLKELKIQTLACWSPLFCAVYWLIQTSWSCIRWQMLCPCLAFFCFMDCSPFWKLLHFLSCYHLTWENPRKFTHSAGLALQTCSQLCIYFCLYEDIRTDSTGNGPSWSQTSMDVSESGNGHFISVCKSETRTLPPVKSSLRCLLLKTTANICFQY